MGGEFIAEARPGPTSTPSSVQDLVHVHLLLQGKRSQLFGMQDESVGVRCAVATTLTP